MVPSESVQQRVLWLESCSLVQASLPPMVVDLFAPGATPPVTVQATEHWFTVDFIAAPGTFRKPKATRLYEVPMGEVATIQVDDWSAERSQYGWKLGTGFLHRPDVIGATSGLVLTARNGHHLVFRLSGPAIAARARTALLLNYVTGA